MGSLVNDFEEEVELIQAPIPNFFMDDLVLIESELAHDGTWWDDYLVLPNNPDSTLVGAEIEFDLVLLSDGDGDQIVPSTPVMTPMVPSFTYPTLRIATYLTVARLWSTRKPTKDLIRERRVNDPCRRELGRGRRVLDPRSAYTVNVQPKVDYVTDQLMTASSDSGPAIATRVLFVRLSPNEPRLVSLTPNLLTSKFQITIASRNRNSNIGIYYDHLHAYASYRNQQITLASDLPPTYQRHKENSVWSPLLYGNQVPIAPFNAVALGDEQNSGVFTLTICVDGQVRWKVGTLTIGNYHLHVRCQAFINQADKAAGVHVGENTVKYTLINKCSVNF
ncbi:unnamed protein product [Arabidopsis thaliana]|uniref:(thale cress) hypothetical protein n=1 Tax=Arabidopsis thaliana TaxID=3702 RepID=A0A7G2F267_ARATH|nr:unnamed protein product [Arabidopsis thaliana]